MKMQIKLILNYESEEQQLQGFLKLAQKYNIDVSSYSHENDMGTTELTQQGIDRKLFEDFKSNFSNFLNGLISNLVLDFRKHFKMNGEKLN
ncbi:hypothetical protein [Bacillus toyonensis]|uniref:hypothetical protein n=1 Tax=Bacillus toyonensis TaxID=155322 RepID=UPI0019056665|nr:hypothetical protein [Bacillus toyonensis]QQN86687.1 hypothetical protein I0K03_27795 [Bacillus toyonensis]